MLDIPEYHILNTVPGLKCRLHTFNKLSTVGARVLYFLVAVRTNPVCAVPCYTNDKTKKHYNKEAYQERRVCGDQIRQAIANVEGSAESDYNRLPFMA